jgi:hypothetical protein
MEKVGKFYGHLEHITASWYMLWPCGNLVVISSILVYCVKKNLATLVSTIPFTIDQK